MKLETIYCLKNICLRPNTVEASTKILCLVNSFGLNGKAGNEH